MGRILEALKQAGLRGAPAEPAPSPRPLPADAYTPKAMEEAGRMDQPSCEVAEIPFIEVGGPGPTHPAVLPARAPRSGRPDAASASSPILPKTPNRPAPKPASAPAVTFQPSLPLGPSLEPPGKRLAPQLIAYHEPHHPVSEQYRLLLGGLTAQWPGGLPHLVLLTGATSGVGTTTVLLNLAFTRARQGSDRIVVVDANLRRPALAERLGLPAGPGLREVAAGLLPWQRALQESGQPKLWVLTAGETVVTPKAWPPVGDLRWILHQLQHHFDWVLVDSPSWDEGPDMVAVGPACEVVYLVLRPDQIDTPAVQDLGRLIPQLGSHLGGYIVAQR